MPRRKRAAQILALAISVGAWTSTTSCAGEGSHQFQEPPSGTYVTSSFQLMVNGTVQSADGAQISSDFFSAADVRPLLGRFFVDAEYRSGAAPTVVLGYDLWQRAFQGSPQVIGSTIQLNGRPATVVGIAERGFSVPKGASLWVPKPAA
jgi:hypothetical protein